MGEGNLHSSLAGTYPERERKAATTATKNEEVNESTNRTVSR
mgnify:CR=1 FL=1